MAFLTDGFKTIITFALNGAVLLREREVTPPGLDSGGAIDTTTMRNIVRRTKAPKSLTSIDDAMVHVSYDPHAYTQIAAMLTLRQLITFTFPDGSHFSDYGWIDKFKPTGLKEGEFPLAELTLIFGSTDNTGAEVLASLP